MPKKSSSSVRIFYPRFNKEAIIQAINSNLENVKRELPLLLVVLFGSYAKGNYTAASDVDLLVVYGGKQKEEAFAIVKRALDIPHLEPHLYTEAQFEEMKDKIKMMVKEGIVLFSDIANLQAKNLVEFMEWRAKQHALL